MQEYLWINRWNDKRKSSAIENQKSGSNFLSSYQMNDFRTVLYELMVGLNMIKGSESSGYVCFIPPSGNEVVKIRLSDHPSTIEEWNPKEISGLPNRRYSIVIFSNKSMPNESKQKIKELDWKSYEAGKIPVYEKTFNRYYLKETFPQLLAILQAIYRGVAPEDNTLPMNITENKETNENRKMNKKQTIRLNEAQFNSLVKESVKRVLKEDNQSKTLFSIRAWLKGIHQYIDGLEIAMENGRAEKLLPQFITNVRYTLEQIENDIDVLRGRGEY